MLSKKYIYILFFSLMCLGQNLKAESKLVIIVNHSNEIDKLSLEDAQMIFMGTKNFFKNGNRVSIVDQDKEGSVYSDFYKRLINLSPKEMSIYWAKLLFAGKGRPPFKVDNDKDVITWVENNVNGIGYITSDHLDQNVKQVLMLP